MMKHIGVYIDIAFCLVFLPLMILMFPVERWWGTYPAFLTSFILWLYATYFAYKYFILPRLFGTSKARIAAGAAIVASLLVTMAFSSYNITSPYYHHLKHCDIGASGFTIWGVRQNQQAVWLHYIIVTIFSMAVGLLAETYKQRIKSKDLEIQRDIAELSLYKAQINPHFMFNTLNTIYGLLLTKSDKTEAALERFINITKYIYSNANAQLVSLADEVDYITQYIDLQRLRLNSCASVVFDCRVTDGSVPVPPVLLMTFVENAFKYGISSNETCFITIKLLQGDDGRSLHFEVTNSDFGRPAKGCNQMGIANCRKRLELLYTGKYSLDINRNKAAGTFEVKLQLNV